MALTNNEIKDLMLKAFIENDGKISLLNELLTILGNIDIPNPTPLITQIQDDGFISTGTPRRVTEDGKKFEGYVNRDNRLNKEKEEKEKREVESSKNSKDALYKADLSNKIAFAALLVALISLVVAVCHPG
jgi:hypothetical protein